jgi:hypothetical protein
MQKLLLKIDHKQQSMHQDLKALTLGVATGILITLLILVGSALIFQQLFTVELKVLVNQHNDVGIGYTYFTFVYHPDTEKVSFDLVGPGYGYPAKVGYRFNEFGGEFTVVEVNPEYVVINIRPSLSAIFELHGAVTIR